MFRAEGIFNCIWLSAFTQQDQHALPVIIESRAALLGQGKHDVGAFVLDLLLDFDVTGFLQLAHVGGEIAVSQPGPAEQDDEISALDDR